MKRRRAIDRVLLFPRKKGSFLNVSNPKSVDGAGEAGWGRQRGLEDAQSAADRGKSLSVFVEMGFTDQHTDL